MRQQLVKGKHDKKAVTTQKDNPQESALSDELQERIAKRAYELYLAEHEILASPRADRMFSQPTRLNVEMSSGLRTGEEKMRNR
jgi:hypothetical protein